MGLPSYYNLLDTARGDFVLNAQSLAAVLAVGNQWFVNEATGSDSNPGDAVLPFKTLTAAIAAAPKSLAWKARARVGERLRWYETPEEIQH